jgi:thiamine biosynthesis protein ThiI
MRKNRAGKKGRRVKGARTNSAGKSGSGRKKTIIKYGELWLKSEPVRRRFADTLAENVRSMLVSRGVKGFGLQRTRDMLILEGGGAKAAEVLKKAFGVSWFAEAVETRPTMKGMEKAVLELAKGIVKGQTFAIRASRQDKSLPFTSKDIENEMGRRIDRKVDLSGPDVTIHVEARKGKAYVYSEKVKGAGGLPYGVSGRALSLISGGIDSPVASWLMMRRGCSLDFVHFYSDAKEAAKVEGIVRALREYSPRPLSLYHSPFGEVQEAITSECERRFTCVLCRRLMYRAAEALAGGTKAKALVTGESLAQVASQTLDNLAANEGAVSLPVLRPLLGMDKEETVALAKRIGTFEPSVRPSKPCAFVPKRPATKAGGAIIAREERNIRNPDRLIGDAVSRARKVMA